ncbi:MAG: hypothetical protein AABY22_21405 [Nanoarchaeota archaeon]
MKKLFCKIFKHRFNEIDQSMIRISQSKDISVVITCQRCYANFLTKDVN